VRRSDAVCQRCKREFYRSLKQPVRNFDDWPGNAGAPKSPRAEDGKHWCPLNSWSTSEELAEFCPYVVEHAVSAEAEQ